MRSTQLRNRRWIQMLRFRTTPLGLSERYDKVIICRSDSVPVRSPLRHGQRQRRSDLHPAGTGVQKSAALAAVVFPKVLALCFLAARHGSQAALHACPDAMSDRPVCHPAMFPRAILSCTGSRRSVEGRACVAPILFQLAQSTVQFEIGGFLRRQVRAGLWHNHPSAHSRELFLVEGCF